MVRSHKDAGLEGRKAKTRKTLKRNRSICFRVELQSACPEPETLRILFFDRRQR